MMGFREKIWPFKDCVNLQKTLMVMTHVFISMIE